MNLSIASLTSTSISWYLTRHLSGFLGLFFLIPALVATKLRSRSLSLNCFPSINSLQLFMISLYVFVPIQQITPVGSTAE